MSALISNDALLEFPFERPSIAPFSNASFKAPLNVILFLALNAFLFDTSIASKREGSMERISISITDSKGIKFFNQKQTGAFGTGSRVSLGHQNHQIGMPSIGNESLTAVDQVASIGLQQRSSFYAL